jgi:two-component system sensor histidine kinase HydH
MNARKWLPVLLPFSVGLLGSDLHWSLTGAQATWGTVLANLYYIPIVIAAISVSARAALLVSLAAGMAHGAASLLGRGDSYAQPVAQTVLFVCIGLTTAKLAEWLRDRPAPAATTKGSPPVELESSFNEVQDSSQTSALARVVGGLVCQFRTPVTSIEGAGWVLEDARLPEEKRQEFVGIIRKESHRLNRVLSDVLDFTRPRKPRLQPVNLATLIDEVVELAGPKDHGPFFLFRTDVGEDLPHLRCDPELMKQALLNLAMNAIQASPGGGQIEIAARIEQEGAAIRFTDHGHGIPPNILGRVFDPFFTTRDTGLGLGLPVALHIVTEHGGKIAIENTSSRGTCVTVWLPIPEQERQST